MAARDAFSNLASLASPATIRRAQTAVAIAAYLHLSRKGVLHLARLVRAGGAAQLDAASKAELDADGRILLLVYTVDVALAVAGVSLLWTWRPDDVLWHHWPTIAALGAIWITGACSPAAAAGELLATGLLINYNEALWAFMSLYRPPWLQRLQVLIRTSVFPALLLADVCAYVRVTHAEVRWLVTHSDPAHPATPRLRVSGIPPWTGSVARLVIVQLVLAMFLDHAKNFRGSLRLCLKLMQGKFKLRPWLSDSGLVEVVRAAKRS